jgi:hypothetical protein
VIWRVATCGRFNDSFQEICNWPLDDVLSANALLDAMLLGEADARAAAEREAQARRSASAARRA